VTTHGTTQDRETIAEVMRSTRIAVLTYEDSQGRLVSTPMGTQDLDDPSVVWFITRTDSEKAQAIRSRPRVNVSYASDKGWVSLSGTAEVVDDRARLEELWDPSVSAFMEGGPDSPETGCSRSPATPPSCGSRRARSGCSCSSPRAS
jgi:general stress protein 26